MYDYIEFKPVALNFSHIYRVVNARLGPLVVNKGVRLYEVG